MKRLKYNLLYLLSACCLLASSLVIAQDEELLAPEQAFVLNAWMENDMLIAEFQIAPGYYMYRERFDFQIESGSARFDTAIIPDGTIKNDEFFGDMEIYRGLLRIVLPVLFDAPKSRQLMVKASSQGCADIGVCYPPLHQSLAVNTTSTARIYPATYVPPADNQSSAKAKELQALLADATSDNSSSLSVLQSLGEDLGLANEDDIPHPDTAFMLSAQLDGNNLIQSEILIYPNTYLYRDKVKIELIGGNGHSLGAIALPRGDEKQDEFLGETEVFHDRVKISIPIISAAGASEFLSLSYQYQGCVEDRICYPPITKYLQIKLATGAVTIGSEKPSVIKSTQIANSEPAPPAGQSEQDSFAGLLEDVSPWSILLFFLAGIGLTFTPCVFPMIPILSSIIAGQGGNITTSKAFTLSLVYVLSMATTYAVAGAIVGFYGAEFNIQIWFQDPVILSIFAGVFVLLSLSMFGFYDIQMPTAIQSRLSAISNSKQGGTLIGVGLMGLFSAIIVGPCITAPLVGALIFISQTQNWQLGGLALFALGLGMGTPLLIIGTSAGSLLPRAGTWMDAVKSIFGVALLAVAIWLLERVLPVAVTMGLIAALMITSAIYLGALTSLKEDASGWRKLNKAIGIILLLYGAAYLLGAVSDSKDLLQPMRGITSSNSAGSQEQPAHLQFRQIKGEAGLQQALADSVRQQRTTMLDFYADWCISCKEMERYAFTHPDVLTALERVATLQTDVTANDASDTQLMSSLGIYGPPAILFFDASGQEIRHRRVVGEMSGEEFAAHVLATF
ncbi:MAG: protein-disulfide reductase DsbD [Gammaproteobacteria bacterium]|nr:protein-disulfide reductase DsbD [Gammaproteobacteria bacterium]